MPAPDYKWPTYDIAPQEHLQALGAISLNFNLYESGFRAFLNHYMPDDLAQLLFDKLNNHTRQKLLLELIASQEIDSNVKEHIDFLITHFSTCAANRHLLLHARVRGTPSGDVLPLEKNDKDDPGTILQYDLKVGDLRRTADEMRAGYHFMVGILQFLNYRQTERGIVWSLSSPLLGTQPAPKPHCQINLVEHVALMTPGVLQLSKHTAPPPTHLRRDDTLISIGRASLGQ